MFAGRRPLFSALGDITFNHPVGELILCASALCGLMRVGIRDWLIVGFAFGRGVHREERHARCVKVVVSLCVVFVLCVCLTWPTVALAVHVTARVHDPVRRTVKKTNDFAFSFDLYDDNMNEVAVPPVRPMTYAVSELCACLFGVCAII